MSHVYQPLLVSALVDAGSTNKKIRKSIVPLAHEFERWSGREES